MALPRALDFPFFEALGPEVSASAIVLMNAIVLPTMSLDARLNARLADVQMAVSHPRVSIKLTEQLKVAATNTGLS